MEAKEKQQQNEKDADTELQRIATLTRIESKRFCEKLVPEDFDFQKLIGSGAQGKIFIARSKSKAKDDKAYAIKVVLKSYCASNTLKAMDAMRERKILELANASKFLTGLQFAFQTGHLLFLGLNFYPGGDLYRHMVKEGTFHMKKVKFYLTDVAIGLCHLHKLNVVHCDIKPENILIDNHGRAVIADFGLAIMLTAADNWKSKGTRGTDEYMAPEMVARSPFGFEIDWFALGVLMYEMICGDSPFRGRSQKAIHKNIQSKHVCLPPRFGKIAGDLLLKLLEKDPSKRLGSAGIRDHDFFAGLDWIAREASTNVGPLVSKLRPDNEMQCFDPEITNEVVNLDAMRTGAECDRRLFCGYSYFQLDSPQRERIASHEIKDDLDNDISELEQRLRNL